MAQATPRIRTQADLASLVGVSQKTVNKALHDLPGVSAHIRRRVQRVAAEHGYRLNAAAKAVSTGRHGAVSLLLSAEGEWSVLPPGLLGGVQAALAEHELHLIVSSMPDDKLTDETFLPKILRESLTDGLLINYNARIPPRMIDIIRRHRIPSVWINSKQEKNCVRPDDEAAAGDLTRRILERGHRRVAYLDYAHDPARRPTHYSSAARRDAYRDAMRDAGLTPAQVGSLDERATGRIVASLRAALATEDRPTAVIGYGLLEANAALTAALSLGLDVPRQLSIACFNDRASDDLGPRIATALIPEQEIGRVSVEMLMEVLASGGDADERVLPFAFDDGQTLGPAQ